jgi:hypothetical protein
MTQKGRVCSTISWLAWVHWQESKRGQYLQQAGRSAMARLGWCRNVTKRWTSDGGPRESGPDWIGL